MTANNGYWVPIGPGQVEEARPYPGRLTNEDFTDQGRADIMAAARQQIMDKSQRGTEQKIALFLLEEDGPEIDLYRRQTENRWLVEVGYILFRAHRLMEVLRD